MNNWIELFGERLASSANPLICVNNGLPVDLTNSLEDLAKI